MDLYDLDGIAVQSVKVLGTQEAAIASLVDNTTGATDGTLDDMDDGAGAVSLAELQNNVAELNAKLDAVLTALRNHGIIAT